MCCTVSLYERVLTKYIGSHYVFIIVGRVHLAAPFPSTAAPDSKVNYIKSARLASDPEDTLVVPVESRLLQRSQLLFIAYMH